MKLLPYPRWLKRDAGEFVLPDTAKLRLDASLSREVAAAVLGRLKDVAKETGVKLQPTRGRKLERPAISFVRREVRLLTSSPTAKNEGYALTIDGRGVRVEFGEIGGLHAAVATLRQLLREHGRALPALRIRDYPDFPRRGVMLDISRGRVPRLETLLELVGHLADFKINEFQLYLEHTFAYRKYRPVWRDWGALTAEDIRKLDAHCRGLGIDLVPNQNSFGHLREFLAHPPLKKLAEVAKPWPDEGGAFLRRPSTLAPANPGTLPFLRGLYDELLPNFTSRRFNVGCDETWDLGRGQSRELCEQQGKGRVYLDFLKQIRGEVSGRGKQMMFWGDIILHYPKLVKELPRDVMALNWGYEAGHPFDREAARFAKAGIPFYVCPGTSTWMTMLGRHDNAFANLRHAAKAGLKHGAAGYLITDWGDGGHPQPLAVSYLPYLHGAALSWCGTTADEALLPQVLNRDVFRDPTGRIGQAALALGLAHRQFKFTAPNLTPFGAVVAAPPPKQRELFCRDGLKYFARIPEKNIRAAREEVEAQRSVLFGAAPASHSGEVLAAELDLAARMAAQSCQYMLWQQAVAARRTKDAKLLASYAVRELERIDGEFAAFWPARNLGTPKQCAMFLQWRLEDYRRGVLHFSPVIARKSPAA